MHLFNCPIKPTDYKARSIQGKQRAYSKHYGTFALVLETQQ
jgi:hypothetical protein